MTRPWNKARGERATFRVFAQAAGFPFRWQSIRSRPEPEPDIRCTIAGRGRIAFELGEVVVSRFAETTMQRQALRRRFAEAYATLPPLIRAHLEQRLGGSPTVSISFPSGTSPGTWRHAIAPILSVLGQRAGEVEHGAEIPVWGIAELKRLLTDMVVRRGGGRRASLHVVETTEVHDQTGALLTKKFGRAYRTSLPIELVACYLSQPPPNRDGWRQEVTSFIAARLDASPFQRVWLYNNFTHSVPLVYPPLSHLGRGAGGRP
jgi:hypothetical protein